MRGYCLTAIPLYISIIGLLFGLVSGMPRICPTKLMNIKQIKFILHELQMFMHLIPRLIFNDGAAGEQGGGAPDTTATDQGSGAAQTAESIAALSIDELKGYGFDSKEALLNHLNQHKANNVSDEEKAKAAGIEKAELMRFSVENDIMKPEDFTKYESLSQKEDRDLVFERYAAEAKEENPDISDEDLKEAFESEYKLNSDNEKTKQRGLSKIEKEAKEIRSPLENQYTSAKEKFADDRKVRQTVPQHNQFMDGVLKENIPDKFVVKIKDGETEVPVEVEITDEIRKKAAEKFKTTKTFYDYLKAEGKTDDLKKSLSQKIQTFLIRETHAAVTAKVAETFKEIGTKAGSNIGAEQPFAVVKGGKNPNADKGLTGQQSLIKNQTELRDKVPAYR